MHKTQPDQITELSTDIDLPLIQQVNANTS